ncbi:hypothetical protein SDC9_199121 [bioreactor metagenome]|uniref:Uncharacterized protein n=1 Tax=bioreactor metagenome TaxID=1076179 RepID=A0A645IJK9_9ZZZZ
MRHASIDDVHRIHPRLGSIQSPRNLGQHAAGNRTVGKQRINLARRQIRQQIAGLVQNARSVG